MKNFTTRRSNITVDDRRMVLVMAKGRKPSDIRLQSNEAFIRNALKDRLGWPHKEPASPELLAASKQMAKAIAPQKEAVTS
jgi:hypothetical protein